MFFSSAMQFVYNEINDPDIDAIEAYTLMQTLPGTRTAVDLRYKILYRYWAGSLA